MPVLSLPMLKNGQALDRRLVPALAPAEFRKVVTAAVQDEHRLLALFGLPESAGGIHLWAVLGEPRTAQLRLVSTRVQDRYPALTPDCSPAWNFEREIAEQWGVVPEGHPWLKPLRFHRAWRTGADAWNRAPEEAIPPAVTDFFPVRGEEIHEVAVGPVHAGVIEPGHFRFQCRGEDVLYLEIALGFQHRGGERALAGGPNPRTPHYAETLAGDTTIGHAWAYCQAVEALAGVAIPPRAQALRAIALELERLANHTGDLGALANDIGFLPTASYCGRLRGDFLNLTALLCGSRFGRGLLLPGGVRFDLEPARAEDLAKRLEATFADVENAVNLLWETPSVMARFEGTGLLSPRECRELGITGLAARASGLTDDVRQDFPFGVYREAGFNPVVWFTGDVYARAMVRWLEIQASVARLRQRLPHLPDGNLNTAPGELRPEAVAVSLTEGWRGAICHVAMTDAAGRFERYKVVDPSFHNWIGLAMAMRNQPISDFPLCNKSFNLSYCGHDL